MRPGLWVKGILTGLLLAVSVYLGIAVPSLLTGETGNAHGLQLVIPEKQEPADQIPATAVLVAEVDPIDQLLSTPSPYERKEQAAPPSGRKKSGSPKAEPVKQTQRQNGKNLASADQGTDREEHNETPDEEERLSGSSSINTQTDDTQADASQTDDQPENVKTARQPKTVYLFNTAALFPKAISQKTAPQWHRVLKLQKEHPVIFANGTAVRMPKKVAKRWFALREQIENADDFTKAKEVNKFFNTWPYRTDEVVWKVPEYWATPEEFLVKSGDCEDYAITKYFALRSLGIPAEKMRIVAVEETIRGIGHAVLAFYHKDTAYILDNLSSIMLEHSVLTNYRPQFSVNEEFRWGHARIVKKKK